MTFKNINERFSEIVSGYLSNGYNINTGTMGGSQGEISKVDVTNGKEILRVLIRRVGSLGEPDGVKIIVGRCRDKVRANRDDSFDIIWNDHMEILHAEAYYALSDYPHNAFGTMDEAKSCQKLRRERSRNADGWVTRIELPTAAKKIALSYIQRKHYSSYKLKDIESVCKEVRDGKATYVIHAKGKYFKIK